MSAPISIPIQIEDKGASILTSLVGQFEDLASRGDRLTVSMTGLDQATPALQSRIETLNAAYETLVGGTEGAIAAQEKLSTMFGQVGTAAGTATDTMGRYGGSLNAISGQSGILGDALRMQADGFDAQAAAADRATTAIGRQMRAKADLAGVPAIGGATTGPAYPSAVGGADTGLTYGPAQPAPLSESMIAGYSPLSDTASAASARAANTSTRVQALIDEMNGVPVGQTLPPEPAPSEAGGGGSHGYGANSYLMQGLLYGGGYMALSGLKSSIARSDQYSRTLGATQAETGLSSAQAAELGNLTRSEAASGTEPYNSNTLLTGEYSLASLGVGQNTAAMAKSVYEISQIAAKMSGAANAPDTSQATDTLTSAIADYGLNNQNVVANAQRVADQLQVGVKVGKAEMPAFAQQFAVPATEAHQLGVSTGDVIAYLASESAGGLPTGEMGQDLFSLLRSSQKTTPMQRRESQALGLNYDSSFWGTHGLAGGSDLIRQKMADQGLTAPEQATVLQQLFGNQAASKGYGAALAGGLSSTTAQVNASGGAVDYSYQTSQQYAGMKLADAETKLSTAFDNLTTATLPALTLAVGALSDGVNAAASVFDTWGKKAPSNPAGGTAGDTFLHLITPGSPGFFNPGAAKDMAARGTQDTGFFPSVGHFFDANVTSFLTGYHDTTASKNIQVGTPTAASHAPHDGLYFGGGASGPGRWEHTTAPPLTGGGGPTYVPPRPDLSDIGRSYGAQSPGGYSGPLGANSDAYRTAMSFGHGASVTNPDLTAALNRFTLAISTDAGKQTVESALGTYTKLVEGMPANLLPGTVKSLDIHKADVAAQRYERGPADQLAIQAAQQNLDAANLMHATPAQLKQVQDDYLNALRQLYKDTESGTRLAASLRGVNQQGTIYSDQAATLAVNRQVKDLQDQASMDQLNHNLTGLTTAQHDLLAFQSAHKAMLGLDSSDLALLKAQNLASQRSQALLTPGPTLIRGPESGMGDALAGYGSTTARLSGPGGENPLAATVRHLQETVILLQQQLVETQKNGQTLSALKDVTEEQASGTPIHASAPHVPPQHARSRVL